MDYLSLFSGIEAASVAWSPLGWLPLAFAEVDAFPRAVLKARFPSVPNLGDVTKVNWRGFVRDFGRPDVLVGGSPCQSFSIAGTRTGLEGASGLMWEYVRAVREVRPEWVLWENVPGALSSSNGEDFRCLLEALDALGYGLAWRVLDAQFFGVAQRRERVFLVGRLGSRPPVEVLFEPKSVLWDSKPSREKRKELAARAGRGPSVAGFKFHQGAGAGNIGFEVEQSPTCTADWHNPAVICMADDTAKAAIDRDVCGTLKVGGSNLSETGCLNPEDPQSKRVFTAGSCAPTLSSGTTEGMNIQPSVLVPTNHVVLMTDTQANTSYGGDVCGTLTSHATKDAPVLACGDGRQNGWAVRRLTPRECERLQGFPDDWTLIPWKGRPAEECPDGPRYKAIGNSMAVPVMRWLGERIAMADEIPPEEVEL